MIRKYWNDQIFRTEKEKNILLTNEGINNVEKIFSNAGILKNNNFYDPENLGLVHHVNQSLRANHLFEKGRDYIIQNDSLKIIDELTGRILEGRRFGDGLHQALEAKERIDVQAENQTLASITYQNYFRLYKKLSGMTGTTRAGGAERTSSCSSSCPVPWPCPCRCLCSRPCLWPCPSPCPCPCPRPCLWPCRSPCPCPRLAFDRALAQ